MKNIHKILITLGLALLCFAGCESDLTGVRKMIDGSICKSQNSFLFTQEYGYSDTVGESLIIGDYLLPHTDESYVTWITTGDSVRNNLFKLNFKFYYNTQNPTTIDFGNGVSKLYYGYGIDTIKYFCNTRYEIIIVNE